jgi:hypothetical protein
MSRARLFIGANAEAQTRSWLIRNAVRNAIFAQRAGNIFRERLVLARPDFGSRLVRVPIVRQRSLRVEALAVSGPVRRWNFWHSFLALHPIEGLLGLFQIASPDTNFEAGHRLQIIWARGEKPADVIVDLRVPETDAFITERRLQCGKFGRIGTSPEDFKGVSHRPGNCSQGHN